VGEARRLPETFRPKRLTLQSVREPIDFIDFESLHLRHPRLSSVCCAFLAEAARVALSRHHASPQDIEVVVSGKNQGPHNATWSAPTPQVLATHGNTDDCTEYGAYCLAIAAVEQQLQMFAIGRCERKTGADYFVHADPNCDDYETATRLEATGTDEGGVAILRNRLQNKLDQLKRGTISGPGVAVAVGFRALAILMETSP